MTYAQRLARYREKHGRLVAPKQGWESLYPSLWLAYSVSVKRGWYDVGTYAAKPGDHSWGDRHGEPGAALAFDLRRKGWVGRFGWGWMAARRHARFLWSEHEAFGIDYVIVGRKYVSRKSGGKWVPLTTGDTSHDWHIHVSGWVPGK